MWTDQAQMITVEWHSNVLASAYLIRCARQTYTMQLTHHATMLRDAFRACVVILLHVGKTIPVCDANLMDGLTKV